MMCGTRLWAKPGITILYNQQYTLLVQGDKVSCCWTFLGHVLIHLQYSTVTEEPTAQVIAEAIAAFVENNGLRLPRLP